MASEANPSVDALCKLFTAVIGEGDDANVAVMTVREKKSIIKTIAALSKGKSSLFKDPSVATTLRVMDAVAEISNANVNLLSAIGQNFRHMSLSQIALNYFDVSIPGLDRAKWELELFRLEPTAVMASLVISGNIVVVPQDVRIETERILRAAVQENINLSAQPLRRLREMAGSSVLGSSSPVSDSSPEAPTFNADVFRAAVDNIHTIQRLQAVVANPRHIAPLMAAGLVSAKAISMLDPGALAKRVEGQIPAEQAVRIHDNAFTITARNEQTWVEILKTKSDNLLPATRPKHEKDDGNNDDGNGNKDKDGVNFSTLFGSLDDIGNDGAESVLSPAAYLVDLLDTLRNHVVSPKSGTTLLDKLEERRIDLGWLQLTTENTYGTISYLDLANEVMEQYLAKNTGKKLGEGYPKPVERLCAEAETANTSLIEPSNIQIEIYSQLIQPTVWPLNHFPYNYGIDFVKTALVSLGLNLHDLLTDFTSGTRRLDETLPPGALQSYSKALLLAAEESLQRVKSAQLLDLEETDYVCITHESFIPVTLFREAIPGKRAMDIDAYQGWIEYDGCAEYWGYDNDEDMVNMSEGGLTFIQDQLLKRCGLKFDELVEILQTSFMRARAIITSHDGCSAISQDLETLRLRASVLVSDNGVLTEDICSDLQSFIRLRHRLRWDTRTLDAALYALGHCKPSAFSGVDAEIIQGLADIKQLSDLSGIAVSELCPLFGNVDRNGPDSLYSRLCRRSSLRPVNDAFELNEGSAEGGHKPVAISAKLYGLSSALQISANNVQLVLKTCGLDVSSPLTLETFSAIYRTHKLSIMFGTGMNHYDYITSLYGFDTRKPLPSPGYVLASLSQWKSYLGRGLNMELVLNFMGKREEDSKNSRELAHTMFSGLQAVLKQWPEVATRGTYTEADVAAAAAALNKDTSTEVVDYIEGKRTVSKSIEDSRTTVRRIPDRLREYITVDHRRSGTVIVLLHGLPDDSTKSMVIGLEVEAEKQEEWKKLMTSLIEEGTKPSSDISALVADSTIKAQLVSGSRDTRRTTFLSAARKWLRKQQLEALVIKTLQSPALDATAIRSLLSEGVATNYLADTVDALTEFSTNESLDTLNDEKFEASLGTLASKIRRIEGIVTHFGITLPELRLLQPRAGLDMVADLGMLDTLAAYQQLKSPLSSTQRDALATLLGSGKSGPPNGNNRGPVERIADALGWPASTLTHIFAAKYSKYSDVEAQAVACSPTRLLQMRRILEVCTKLDLVDTQLDSVFGWVNDIGAVDKAFSLAATLRKTLEARSTGGQVSNAIAAGGTTFTGAQSGMHQLKERRRNALINYLLKDEELEKLGITSADDLYDFFLIDVKMGAEMQTSRIRQAISTVQLFVQRCFLGIEVKYGVSAAMVHSLKARWDTICRFTLWEANRRVFLYPENWVDPTLRDTKTEPFKALEAAILQGDLTEESISKVVKSYIYGMQPIAHLDVQAYLWEKGENDRGRFHFFGRTRTEPHRFYYRKLELEPFGKIELLPYWHPWTSLDLGAPPQAVDNNGETQQRAGSYLVPTLLRGRLMLFVPEISLKAKASNTIGSAATTKTVAETKFNDYVQPSEKYWEIKMAWTELRDGQWSPRVTSPDSLIVKETVTEPLPAISAFRFRVRARSPGDTKVEQPASFATGVDGVLIIDVESWRWVETQDEGKKKVAVPRRLGQFEMRGTELYLTENLKAVFDENLMPTTLPTRFSKLDWTEVPGQKFPSYTLEYRKAAPGSEEEKNNTRKASMRQPLLVDTAEPSGEKRDLSWTLVFDDTQTTRPVGLLVDVKKSSTGAESFFARPRVERLSGNIAGTETVAGLSSIDIFPFHHTFSNSLLEAAVVTGASVDDIYATISDRAGDSDAFGFYGGQLYHELFDAYSVYNWELGVHVVSLLMERLLAHQQFDLALKVARLLFDPTKDTGDARDSWSFPPFRDSHVTKGQSVRSLLASLARAGGDKLSYTDLAVQDWKRNSFNAHSIARSRPATYMRRVAQKYVEILIAAGDAYFRQASTESIPMAIQRYIEATHVLGPRPPKVKSMGRRQPHTFRGLLDSTKNRKLDTFANAAIDMELEFPYSCLQQIQVAGSIRDNSNNKKGLLGFLATTYFCVPANPELIALWDRVEDRLGKLRASQDINGMALRLPLFDPPIDPGLLVNAVAGDSGGLAAVMTELDSPLPNYRFIYLVGKAVEMANQLSGLTDMFLSAKEKRDTEALSQLKNQQEIMMQAMHLEQKHLQKEEAEKSVAALEDLRKSHESRLAYYLRLVGENASTGIPGKDADWKDLEQSITEPSKHDDLRMSREEKLEFEKSQEAADLSFAATIMDTTASTLLALPNLMTQTQPMGVGVSLKFDAENVAKCLEGMSTVMKLRSTMCEMEGSRAARRGGLVKQLQERRLQANMAGREIKQVDKQIDTALVRVRMSEADIKIQEESGRQAAATEAWYRNKYTNEALYAWMEDRTRALCFDAYGLTMDLARKAEKAFQFERGAVQSPSRSFISPKGYWNNGHDGLLGAQSLLLDLRRMEAAYMETSPADFELVKNISLRQVSPLALASLRMHGVAVFSLPESLFDLDFPGHYYRRIASVSVSVPCVTGPYTSLNCTLSLLEHSYRVSPLASVGDYVRRGGGSGSDDRFRTDRIPVSSVALSQRSADSGVFELNFNGERYLPFENAGAISTWKLELPQHVRQFEYESIADVVVHLRYRSRQGGAFLRAAAVDAVTNLVKAADAVSEGDGLFAMVDLISDCSNAWTQAQAKAKAQSLSSAVKTDYTVKLGDVRVMLPYWAIASPVIKCRSAMLVSRCSPETASTFSVDLLWGENSEKSFSGTIVGSSDHRWDVREINDMDAGLSDWRLRVKSKNSSTGANFSAVENMLLLIRYTTTI
ncbi:hypothetical protein V8F20_009564 [Naviculisporaceae sp. PSN 640]